MRRIHGRVIGTVIFIVLILAVSSCDNKKYTSPTIFTPSMNPTIAVINTPDIKITEIQKNIEIKPTESPSITQKITSYSLEVFYDNEYHLIKVNEKVDFINQTEVELNSIPFVIPSNVQFSQISINSEPINPFPEINENSLLISLSEPLAIDESVEIQFSYILVIPAEKEYLEELSSR